MICGIIQYSKIDNHDEAAKSKALHSGVDNKFVFRPNLTSPKNYLTFHRAKLKNHVEQNFYQPV